MYFVLWLIAKNVPQTVGGRAYLVSRGGTLIRLLEMPTNRWSNISCSRREKKTRELISVLPVPVRRFPSLFRLDHVTRNALAARNNEPRD